jgi:hypothetical protein
MEASTSRVVLLARTMRSRASCGARPSGYSTASAKSWSVPPQQRSVAMRSEMRSLGPRAWPSAIAACATPHVRR